MATKQLTTIRLDENLLEWVKGLAEFSTVFQQQKWLKKF